ncbi:hypothetical protein DHEL01_v210313 [Diaporthe helianthi]|uniref:Uncharacterized protein n=1 Tax=Diaporthe helianthi TaxID=158607 RepID=A0A2P5HM18_DIAHE|nr:hypothetical protein DHEL01_v210313 [Diaporthe helianthi]
MATDRASDDASNKANNEALMDSGEVPTEAKLPSHTIRNKIYFLLDADIPKLVPGVDRAISDFSLRQPALARVNRLFRSEVLPIFYSGKNFGIRIYPKTHAEADTA